MLNNIVLLSPSAKVKVFALSVKPQETLIVCAMSEVTVTSAIPSARFHLSESITALILVLISLISPLSNYDVGSGGRISTSHIYE